MHRQAQQFIYASLLAFAFWLMLVGNTDRHEMVAGLLVALAVGALTAGRPPILSGIRLTPTAPLRLLAYLGVLCWALLRANLDMARRVLSPSLPIRPGMVQIRTNLRSDLGRLALANSITLTPGTLAVDVVDDLLLVHWIDCPPDIDIETATRVIARDFEDQLRGFLE